jgi:hypothetical protein
MGTEDIANLKFLHRWGIIALGVEVIRTKNPDSP